MMAIQCMAKAKCEWPDCSCSDATKKGRWLMPKSYKTECMKCGGGTGQEKPCTCAVEKMHSEGDYERADPQKMQAVINEHFGPVLTNHPDGTPKMAFVNAPQFKTIPIQAIDVAEEEPAKFDADVLAIMLHEAGATVDPDGCFYIERPALRKLAEALNNL